MIIEKSDIYNQEDFTIIEQYSMCIICRNILFEPLQCTGCSNYFCTKCWDMWKESKKTQECPYKCENFSYRKCKLIIRMLSIIKFKCKNNCDYPIPYEELSSHYETDCPAINWKEKYLELKREYEKIKHEIKELCKINNLNNEVQLQIQFKSKYHIHPLMPCVTDRSGWFCDTCRTSYEGTDKSYYCTLCDVDLCLDCKHSEENNLLANDSSLERSHSFSPERSEGSFPNPDENEEDYF